MSEHVVITEGNGRNVSVIDSIVNIVTTNDAVVDLEVNTFYTLGDSSLQTLNLPLVSKFGDMVGVSGVGSGLFKVVQRANEQILYGVTDTTIGTFGTFESTQRNDVVYLRRINAPGIWLAYDTQGDFLIDAAGSALLNNAINNTVSGKNVTAVDPNTFPTGDDQSIIFDGVGPELKFKYLKSNNNPVNGVGVFDSTEELIMTCNNPDQTVVIDSGAGISVTGTYPNFTVTNTALSSARSYGSVKKTFISDTQVVNATFARWNTGAFSSGPLSNFTRSATRLTYTGATTHTFLVSITPASADTADSLYTFAVFKNGVGLEGSENFFRNSPASGGSHASAMTSYGSVLISLSQNDYIEPFVNSSILSALQLVGLHLSAIQIS